MPELMKAEFKKAELDVPGVQTGLTTEKGFHAIQRIAQCLAASDMVPKQFQGNIPNCVIAIEMAHRMGASPFAVMQSIYIVHGKPGWEAKFIIASINATGKYTALRYKMDGEGDKRGCVAWAKELATGEILESPRVDIALAKAEGWFQKTGSKWKTMPDLMLRYRSATLWGHLYSPELIMGMATVDELDDIGPDESKSLKSLHDMKPGQRVTVAQVAPTVLDTPALKPPPEPSEPLFEREPLVQYILEKDPNGDLFNEACEAVRVLGASPDDLNDMDLLKVHAYFEEKLS